MRHPTFLPYAIGLLLLNAGVALAGQTTLTTYYPAPSGNYDQLRLVPRAAMAGSCLPGTLYVNNSGTLQYCDNSSVWGNRNLVWNQSGNNIYPADTATNPNINVGIGKTNPAYKLDVNGAIGLGNGASIASSITNLLITGGGIGPQVVQISDTLSVTGSLQTGNNLNVNGNIMATGSVTASGFFYSPSDRRLKKDIHPLTHALDKVQRLNGVAFTWKKNSVKDIGVIAQNVESVLPELVSTGKDGMKSVKYANLVAVLIEAVKEQQKQIEDLKKEVAELQNKQPAH